MGKNERDDFIDSHVSSFQCRKAATALMKYVKKVEKKEETELLPGKEENIWLVLSVKKLSPEKRLKSFRIPLAHPIINPRADPICLITKDPQREYKDLLESHNIRFMNRVVGVEKLKGKFRPFEARRILLKENGLFLADERVIHLLPKLLGKNFYKAKKQPIPVSLTKKDLKKELEQAVASTYMHQNQGSCSSVKVGTISQSPAHILENLKIALPEIVKRISGGWSNMQSLYIKTNSSVSLPIWLCDLGEGEDDWKKPKEHMKKTESSEEINSDDEVTDKAETKNGRKRVTLEEDRSLSKKAKTAVDSEKKSSNEEAAAKPKSVSRKAKSLAGLEAEERVQHNGEEKSETKKKRTGVTSRSSEVADVQPSAKSGASSKSKAATPSSVSPDQKSPTGKVTSRGPSMQTNSNLSKEEVKQKKRILQEGLEKKKEKLARSRLGGSIKECVIGKKSKSQI